MPQPATHLALSHIHKAFGSFVALEDINLGFDRLARGEALRQTLRL